MVVHTCHPSAQEVEVGGSGVQGHSQLHSEFKAILGHMKSSQKNFFKLVFIIDLIANTNTLHSYSLSFPVCEESMGL